MKTVLVFYCLLALSLATMELEWETFKIEFNKKYQNPTEETFRKKIFLDNKMTIERHNRLYDDGKVTFTMGINQFSDMTTQEFNERMNGNFMIAHDPSAPLHKYTGVAAPISFDWRNQNCVNPIKNQGQCGSCWAFATNGAVESAQCIAAAKLASLSEQQLVDCSGPQGNLGCGGGNVKLAYQYIMSNGGITTSSAYPYTATDGTCRYISSPVGATIRGYSTLPAGREDTLRDAVTQQPVAVSIDATFSSFQQYKSGIYYEPSCSQTTHNHAMVVIGYGTENGNDFWTVRNSWGTGWGEAGYIRMSRNRNNNCGISNWASYPNY